MLEAGAVSVLDTVMQGQAFARRCRLYHEQLGEAEVFMGIRFPQQEMVLWTDNSGLETAGETAAEFLTKLEQHLKEKVHLGSVKRVCDDAHTALRLPITVNQSNSHIRDHSLELDMRVYRTGHGRQNPTPVEVRLNGIRQFGRNHATVELRPYLCPEIEDDPDAIRRSFDFLRDLKQELQKGTTWPDSLLSALTGI